MKFRTVVSLLLLITVPPIPGQAPNQPTDKSKNPKSSGGKQQEQPTQVAPAPLVNPLTPPNPQGDRTEEKKNDHPVSISAIKPLDVRADVEKDWMDKLNWVFTAALVLIAGFGVLYARKTLKAIEGQLTEIKSAGQQTDLLIRHAGDQSETARQSLLITQRAFFTHVRYQLTTMFSEPNNQGSLLFFRFVVEYENVGKTPAIEAEMTLGFWKIKKGDSDDFLLPPWEEREGPRIGSRVAPGIKVVGTLDLDREDAEKIATEELSIFLYTQAQYRDVFEGTPIHSSGTCVRLMKIADLRSSAPFQFKLHSARYNYGD